MPPNDSPQPSIGGEPHRFVALQHRDFRLLWTGSFISTFGSQMQIIAVNWHIFELLRGETFTISLFGLELSLGAEALALGGLGLVRVLPIIAFGLLGGLMADTYDRRKLIIGTQVTSAIFAAILAIITLSGNATVGAIYLLTAAGAAATAFDNPARQALLPNLVPAGHLANAVSINTLSWEIATIAGPAAAGLMVAYFDIGLVYALNAVSFVIFALGLLLMHYRGRPRQQSGGLGWAALVEGVRFTYRKKIIWGTMLLDFFATLFSSARMMLPIVAGELLGLGVQGYGLLATAQPVGALVAGFVLSMRREIYRQGTVLLISVAVYGLATALFGLSTAFALSYFLFALTGAGDTVSMVIRNTIRQLNTPDRLRGRMTGVNMIFFMGGPQLGELEAGLVASLFGVSFAIFSGGVATVLLTLVVAWRFPQLRDYVSQSTTYAAE